MPRTWSNAQRTEELSAAQRARHRPSGLTAFSVMLLLAVILFTGLTLYGAIRMTLHPPTQAVKLAQPPRTP